MSNELIVRHLYALSNNRETKFADWVAYVVREEWIGPEEDRGWADDPDLDPDETLETRDYDDISALQADRGHQAPLGSFTNAPDWPETNYISNITPQSLNLNRGRWRRLEDAERNLARREHVPVFVITGPLYERPMPALPRADEPHRVPSGYWKIVATADGRALGFIFENRRETGRYCAFQRDISEIERRSGLNLFPAVDPNALRPLAREIGC
ncbi:DNA/RNA non-specific endonuclease [Terricaulis silvestris]|uniref:Endonuclease n=1 Tax=Terricaulis silvestris TaxID=2686094 RepID=A0A6I6MNH9_9CAUL|nr:DNA/RNA non-specific endonuclease [Terricaulis silvestris]QGZ94908.1 Nuclease precursor [Terricaulis silvestris]